MLLHFYKKKGETLTPLDLLREKGMKTTTPRRQVLEILLERREPLSHTEIYERLAALNPKRLPDRVTLYRVLSAFSDARLVHQIQGTDGTARFCVHDPPCGGCPGNHPHFLCRSCGRMLCLSEQSLPHVEVPEGAIVEGKQLLVFGLCPLCGGEA
jgi:Fur family ferric uptake transcriptional regulator/Fur family zinc uptake transcriptional regulator